ncbi:MAG: GAF domain-containing protein [Acidobacteriia bacterium]|nr:GAF domain-containing protein [Terriglobia bacterium]
MGQSTLRLPDPDSEPRETPAPLAEWPHVERRRRIRQKPHSPAYVSFDVPKADLVVDLSELLDLHEDGFAVQTGEMLEVNRSLALTLDLPETRTFIHGNGEVVWSEPSGRAGVRFSDLPEASKRLLKEWLFANLLIACSDHETRSEQVARTGEMPEEILHEPLPSTVPSGSSTADLSNLLSAVDAVRRVVREIDADRDTIFQLITAHALRLTGASGAALAFLTDNNMICRARAGEPAPPLGAPVDAKEGLSGECVRSALAVGCQDTENDSRVDQETCRRLGIGSILAVPIVSDFRVVGLLEVFSPHPRAFTKAHETVLEQLVETIPKELPDPPLRQDAVTGELSPALSTANSSMHAVREALFGPETEAEAEPETGSSRPQFLSSRLRLGLLMLAIGIAAAAFGYWLAPVIQRHWFGATHRPATPPAASTVSAQNVATRSMDEEPPEAVRKLADAGDADAQYRIGVRYHLGAGVPQDDTQAVQWYLHAAEQGQVDAQASLGAYYWAGRGVPQDLSRAYFWSALAVAQGNEISKSRLEGLASQMTRPQVAIARQQADEWIRQHNSAKSPKN